MNTLYAFLFLPTFLAFLAGCATTGGVKDESLLLGWTDRTTIFSSTYPRFGARYDTVQVSGEMSELIGYSSDGSEWLVFFGSWCSDSWREVPTFLKIVDSAGVPKTSLRFYGLDRDKESPLEVEAQYGIELVPTFILFRGGKEIGRIVEKPGTSMEDDMLLLLTSE